MVGRKAVSIKGAASRISATVLVLITPTSRTSDPFLPVCSAQRAILSLIAEILSSRDMLALLLPEPDDAGQVLVGMQDQFVPGRHAPGDEKMSVVGGKPLDVLR